MKRNRRTDGMRYGRHGQRAALALYTFLHGNRTVRRPVRAQREIRGPGAVGPKVGRWLVARRRPQQT